MSIATELTALQTNLAAAKAAVTSKGGTVGDTGLAGLASEIATIPSGGQEPASGATLTAYDPDTGVLTGTGLGSAGTVYLLDRDTNNYVAQPTTSWSDTSITLETPIDLSTLEGTTSIAVVGTDGKWSTKLLLTGEVAVTGWAKLYIKDPSTGTVRMITVDNSTDFNKLYSSSSDVYARAITIGTDTFYADELVGMQFGEDFTGTSIGDYFLRTASNLSQPITIPSSITSIGTSFLQGCQSFNQPLDLSSVTSIGSSFLQNCYSFNQPLDLSSVTSVGGSFLSHCYSFNQPLDLSSVTSVGKSFLSNCYSFNQPLDLSSVTSIPNSFLAYCDSFNQPLNLSNVTSISTYFLRFTYSFNQPLDLSSVTSIGSNFLDSCYSFNQPLDFSSITSIDDSFLGSCYSFNQPLDLSNITSIGSYFLSTCRSFNHPLTIPSAVTNVGGYFLNGCYSFSDLTVETTASPTDDSSLSCGQNTAKMYVKGVTVKGAGASTWITNLPDRASSPYRKLINGNE